MTQAISRYLLPVVLVVFGAPFVVLFFYSTPAADDFCLATLSYGGVPQRSVWAMTWIYYTKWSPRWLTYLLLSGVTSHVDMAATYGWMLLVVVAASLAALWYFFRTFFGLSRGTSLLAAALFGAAWTASIASPDEQVYWLTNVVVYNLPLCSLLVLVSLLHQPRRRTWYYVLIAALSIAVPAQHEIAGTFLLVLLIAVVVILRVKHIPARQWYFSLVMTAFSYGAVMLSPGNASRAAQEHRPLWDIAHLPRWIAHAFYHGVTWLSVPAVLLAAFCILLLVQQDRQNSGATDGIPKWFGTAGLCAMFVVLCECALIEMTTGTWLPDRIVACFQLLFWLLLVCVILTGAQEIYQVRFAQGTKIAVFTLLAVALLGSENFRSAVEDLRGPAESWWRIDRARLSQRGGALQFTSPTEYPKLAKPQMLAGDPTCWANECLANYLHASTVTVKNSRDECPH